MTDPNNEVWGTNAHYGQASSGPRPQQPAYGQPQDQPMYPPPPAAPQPGYAQHGYPQQGHQQPWSPPQQMGPLMMGPSPYAGPGSARGQRSFFQANNMTLIVFAIVAVYIVLAMTVHLVFFGILPISFALQAWKRKEPLAILGIVAAVGSLLLALALVAGS